MSRSDREHPLSRSWIEQALSAEPPPEVVRPFVRALVAIVHREVAAVAATPEAVPVMVEAIVEAWCQQPRAVLLAGPAKTRPERWFARCARSYAAAQAVAELSGEVAEVGPGLRRDDPSLPAVARLFRAQLSAWERAVFDLVYVERLDAEAAAAELGVQPGVVRRARARLRARVRRMRRDGEP